MRALIQRSSLSRLLLNLAQLICVYKGRYNHSIPNYLGDFSRLSAVEQGQYYKKVCRLFTELILILHHEDMLNTLADLGVSGIVIADIVEAAEPLAHFFNTTAEEGFWIQNPRHKDTAFIFKYSEKKWIRRRTSVDVSVTNALNVLCNVIALHTQGPHETIKRETLRYFKQWIREFFTDFHHSDHPLRLDRIHSRENETFLTLSDNLSSDYPKPIVLLTPPYVPLEKTTAYGIALSQIEKLNEFATQIGLTTLPSGDIATLTDAVNHPANTEEREQKRKLARALINIGEFFDNVSAVCELGTLRTKFPRHPGRDNTCRIIFDYDGTLHCILELLTDLNTIANEIILKSHPVDESVMANLTESVYENLIAQYPALCDKETINQVSRRLVQYMISQQQSPTGNIDSIDAFINDVYGDDTDIMVLTQRTHSPFLFDGDPHRLHDRCIAYGSAIAAKIAVVPHLTQVPGCKPTVIVMDDNAFELHNHDDMIGTCLKQLGVRQIHCPNHNFIKALNEFLHLGEEQRLKKGRKKSLPAFSTPKPRTQEEKTTRITSEKKPDADSENAATREARAALMSIFVTPGDRDDHKKETSTLADNGKRVTP